MSLGIQADTGSSLAEAPRHADQMRLQLDQKLVLVKMPGSMERSTIARYKASFTDIDENEVPVLGRNTH